MGIPRHKEVYRQYRLRAGTYVTTGQWCVMHQYGNPHGTLQKALVVARKSWLRDEEKRAQKDSIEQESMQNTTMKEQPFTLGEHGLFLDVSPNRGKGVTITILKGEQFLTFFLYEREARKLYDWLKGREQ